MSRKHKYILLTWNLLYIVILVICFTLIGPAHRIPWDAIHSKIDASTTFEDLQPRAQQAAVALQATDKFVVSFHSFAIWFCLLGGTWAVVNITLLQLFVRATPPRPNVRI